MLHIDIDQRLPGSDKMQAKTHYINGCNRSQSSCANGNKWGVSLDKFLCVTNRCVTCDKIVSKELRAFEPVQETNLMDRNITGMEAVKQ